MRSTVKVQASKVSLFLSDKRQCRLSQEGVTVLPRSNGEATYLSPYLPRVWNSKPAKSGIEKRLIIGERRVLQAGNDALMIGGLLA